MASRLQDVILRGAAADKPLATSVAPGTLYFSTDTVITERSNGTVWESYTSSTGIASPHHATHEPGGTDVLANIAWTNQANVFTVDQTAPNLILQGVIPSVITKVPTNPVDQRLFRIVQSGLSLIIQGVNDALTLASGEVSMDRLGNFSSTGWFRERGRTLPMGEWIAVPHNAADYIATGGGTWTVSAASFKFLNYMLFGKTITITYSFSGTTVASAGNELRFPIPGGFTASPGVAVPTINHPGGTFELGLVQSNTNYISLQRPLGAVWGSGTVHAQGLITFQIA